MKTPLTDINYEAALLSNLLINPEPCVQQSVIIRIPPEYLTDKKYRSIYSAIIQLVDKGQHADLLNVFKLLTSADPDPSALHRFAALLSGITYRQPMVDMETAAEAIQTGYIKRLYAGEAGG